MRLRIITFLVILLPVLWSCKKENPSDLLTVKERNFLDSLKRELTYAPDPEFPPTGYFDEKGNYSGIVSEYISLIEERLNVKFKIIRYNSWNELLENGSNLKYDFTTCAQKTAYRETFWDFTSPYLNVNNVIIKTKSSKNNITIEDLKRKKGCNC